MSNFRLPSTDPLATILSAAMMLRATFTLSAKAEVVKAAVESVLGQGYRTPDLARLGEATIGTKEMDRRVISTIEAS